MVEIGTKQVQIAMFQKGAYILKRPQTVAINNVVWCFNTMVHLLPLRRDRKTVNFRESPQHMQKK